MFFKKKIVEKEIRAGQHLVKVISYEGKSSKIVEFHRTGLRPYMTTFEIKNNSLAMQTLLQGQIDYIDVPVDVLALILEELGYKEKLLELWSKI